MGHPPPLPPPPPGLGEPDEPPKVTPRTIAEAAAWVARLHGPNRTRQMELACLKWQARSAANRYAFERCTDNWMMVPAAARMAGYGLDGPIKLTPERKGGSRRRRGLLMLALAGAVAVGGGLSWRGLMGGQDYRTGVGESQMVMLDDGSRLSLNTSTRVRVDYGDRQRTITLVSGEAAFEVAKDAKRPFVVRAGASEVVALGTVFSVRLTPAAGTTALAVTLIEGKVSVRASVEGPGAGDGSTARQPVTLAPGDRLRMGMAGPGVEVPQLDRPKIDQVMAWQRAEAQFDQATLAEAVSEMNRYSRTPLVLSADLASSNLLVSGQFRTGDNNAFAHALAALHGLQVKEREGRIELAREGEPRRGSGA